MKIKILKKTFLLILALSILTAQWNCSGTSAGNIRKETFEKITGIRTAKKDEVIGYFSHVKEKAFGVNSDPVMINYFTSLKNYYDISPLKRDATVLNRLELELDLHFVTHYSDFYDILFVDSAGFVFHSIKQESDYHANLFTGRLSESHLAKEMRKGRGRQFVNYDYYAPSDEAAAFFVTSVTHNGNKLGWVVLQAPINKVNAILSDHEGLGNTGEVYLVNEKKLMLTESRFLEDSTILKHRVDTDAVRLAYQKRAGERLIKDYRGVRVYSSFEEFEVLGNKWVIIVEIDEDEVITDHFKKTQRILPAQNSGTAAG